MAAMNHGATAKQVGKAASLRDWVGTETRRELNSIVHSEDQDPDKYGKNPYKGKNGTYDPEAQKIIDKAKLEDKRHGKEKKEKK
mmetsp:Transcript_62092/g.201310  ORF Transcript_62092/g.201310 Transcript_62092/m.201310 type:complete len:84 (+) Transcript_62092:180-431(+)